jgi:hypothetical protein
LLWDHHPKQLNPIELELSSPCEAAKLNDLLQLTNLEQLLLSTYRSLSVDTPYIDGQRGGSDMRVTYYFAEAEDGLGGSDFVNGGGGTGNEAVDEKISEGGLIGGVRDQRFTRWVATVAAARKEAGLPLQRALDIDLKANVVVSVERLQHDLGTTGGDTQFNLI